MNAYKLNSTIAHVARKAISDYLGICHTEIYKEIKDIDIRTGTITDRNGNVYFLTLVKQV